MKTAKLPVGIEDFRRIRTDEFYYVDKTGLIKDLLEHMAYVNLFTRPRRFGKTLNMSMLKCFFEVGCDHRLFEGLGISQEKELCDKYMGKFPVISISLKGINGKNFESAKARMCSIIGNEALRFQFLAHSKKLSETEQQQYKKMIFLNENGTFAMPDSLLEDSLFLLSQFLQKHYCQNVIILIDEYDVPLDKAYQAGYYDEMAELARNIFGQALKTNHSLYFAVLTGCLRISKESIFTGLNNFKVYTVKDVRYNEYFGFTDREVRDMLVSYGLMDQYDTVKEWYDGYQFGNLGIYCPWDVINYCDDLCDGNAVEPQNYWVNTSSNDIIRKFIGKATPITRNEIELLLNGSVVKKKIRQELTYRDIDSKIDNLWSVLFTTGYLTQSGENCGSLTGLVIPNKEISQIFTEQIKEWFEEENTKDITRLESFCKAFQENNVPVIEKGFTSYLKKTISIRDTNIKKHMKENFYHGILLGLLGNMSGWKVRSNAESGEGYSDIIAEIDEEEIGFVIELKYAENASFDAGCQKALQQIKDKGYEEILINDGMKTIYRYGIACYQKRCKVISG
ncbi:hypothetical protein IMSAGC019_02571 [Lachnospiraceae bacterium]|nr:hypothetical protein IMSAGC019_02571 [Lachnospiraceae bacterium]